MGDYLVKSQMLFASVVVIAATAAPLTAQAQGGFPGGFVHGANQGYRIAGPVGAIVGAPVGGVIGGVKGFFGIDSYREPRPTRHRTTRKSG
jgi:hypothetical protein